jgi:hypothetical protein
MEEREGGGLKHFFTLVRRQTFSCGLLCAQSWRAPRPPTPQNSPRGPPSSCIHKNILKTYYAGSYASTRRHMPLTQVSLLYTPGAICTLPPSPPPYLYTSKVCKAFSLSISPPLRGKGMFITFRLRGGGGVLGLIPVCFRLAQTI